MTVEADTYGFLMSYIMPMGWTNFSHAMGRLSTQKEMTDVLLWIQVGHADPVTGKVARYDEDWKTGDTPIATIGHDLYRLFQIGGTARQVMRSCTYDIPSGVIYLDLVDESGPKNFHFPALAVSRIATRNGKDEDFVACVVNPTLPAQLSVDGEVLSPYIAHQARQAIRAGAPLH